MRALAFRGRPLQIWPIAVLCALFTVWGLLHVWVRLQLITIGYEISRQTQLRHDLTELTQKLSLELRTRMDLGTIEHVAHERLQMVAPDPQQLRPLVLPPGAE